MIGHLINHAVQNVWCSPQQDTQSIVKPARLTPIVGIRRTVQIMWRKLALPTMDDTYHVFQVGNVIPRMLGILQLGNTWVSLLTLMNQSTLIGNVYRHNGRMFPLSSVYLRYTTRGNLIIAIKEDKNITGYDQDDIYIRLYSNVFYESDRYDGEPNPIKTDGIVYVGHDQLVDFQRRYNDIRLLPGHVFAYHNGLLLNEFVPANIRLGDVLEYVYDPSVFLVSEFAFTELPSFTSVRDQVNKYLLHVFGGDFDQIEFQDDLEVYLVRYNTNLTRFTGVYHNRNTEDSLRMITHRDYSIPTASITALMSANSGIFNDETKTVLRVYFRRSGYARSLVNESNRIHELYKLPDNEVKEALLGFDATVPEWHAAHLEQSPYVDLMNWRLNNIDPTLVQMAYGYNAMSRLLGDTPVKTRIENNWPVVTLPPAVQGDCTVYEYDENGLLLGWYYSTSHSTYLCQHSQTKLVELIAGQGDDKLDIVYGHDHSPIDKRFNYRAYLCKLTSAGPLFDWSDVSGSTLFTIIDNTLYWTVNQEQFYTAVMSDKKFIADTYVLEPVNGVLRFTISVEEQHGEERRFYESTIPPRRLDVWLNKHSLIEGIDFKVIWPQVVIFNTKYLNPTGTQIVDIRGVNFCDVNMQLETQREMGFVRHGYLSNNRRFDVHDDKVLSFIIDGKLIHRDDVPLAEKAESPIYVSALNGVPYSIRETVVPFRGESYLDTYKLRDDAIAVDTRVSDYMTINFPDFDDSNPNIINARWAVYSPFCSALIYALQNDHIVFAEMSTNNYGTMDIKRVLEPYEYLLDYDPALDESLPKTLVDVLPHFYEMTQTLNVYQHNFLRRALQVYLGDRVSLTQFITVVNPTN